MGYMKFLHISQQNFLFTGSCEALEILANRRMHSVHNSREWRTLSNAIAHITGTTYNKKDVNPYTLNPYHQER